MRSFRLCGMFGQPSSFCCMSSDYTISEEAKHTAGGPGIKMRLDGHHSDTPRHDPPPQPFVYTAISSSLTHPEPVLQVRNTRLGSFR